MAGALAVYSLHMYLLQGRGALVMPPRRCCAKLVYYCWLRAPPVLCRRSRHGHPAAASGSPGVWNLPERCFWTTIPSIVTDAAMRATLPSFARGYPRPLHAASGVLRTFREMPAEEPPEVQPLYSPLSGREIEILDYIARGNSNKEIAKSLKISDQTVKNHITSILKKLSVNDRTAAVVHALKHGWIKMDVE